jgi:hypothetical protein
MMRHAFKVVIVTGLVLTLAGFVALAPVQVGEFFSGVANASEASEWSAPVLIRVIGLSQGGEEKAIGPIEIELENGTVFPLDPRVKLKDAKGEPVSLEQFTSPSKVRFILEKGVVKEMVLIEALPR